MTYLLVSGVLGYGNRVFTIKTLAGVPAIPATLQLYKNGAGQMPDMDYTISGAIVVFTQAPSAGDDLMATADSAARISPASSRAFQTSSGTATIRVRALDSNGDPMRGAGQASFIIDLAAVAQIISTRLLLLQGEWWEDLSQGLPLFQSLLGHSTTSQAVALILRERILGTPYVTAIDSMKISYAAKGRRFIFEASVRTAFGTVTVSNQDTLEVSWQSLNGIEWQHYNAIRLGMNL